MSKLKVGDRVVYLKDDYQHLDGTYKNTIATIVSEVDGAYHCRFFDNRVYTALKDEVILAKSYLVKEILDAL